MRVAFFDTKPYDRQWFEKVVEEQDLTDVYDVAYFENRLTLETVNMADGFDAICVFVNDRPTVDVVTALADMGVTMIALRCAGFDRVALDACEQLGVSVARVPAYSPEAVAEFAAAMLQTLNRKVHIAYNRNRDGNFTLNQLAGFTLHGKTVGVLGTGRIGQCFIKIALGYGCKVIAFDAYQSDAVKALGVPYVTIDELWKNSDVISVHVPLIPATHHLINRESILKMKPGVFIVNTSRGAIVNTRALIKGLKSGHLGGAALDVYEDEEGYFFEDRSGEVIMDDALARLQNMRNVLVTSHQAFLTYEALYQISSVTLQNLEEFRAGKKGKELTNNVPAPEAPVVQAIRRRSSIMDRAPSKRTSFEMFEPMSPEKKTPVSTRE